MAVRSEMGTDRRKLKIDDLSPMSLLVLALVGLLLLQVIVLLSLAFIIRLDSSIPGSDSSIPENGSLKTNVTKCCSHNEIYQIDPDFPCVEDNTTLAEFKIPKEVYQKEIRGEYEKTELQLVNNDLPCKDLYTMKPLENVMDSIIVSKEGILKNDDNGLISEPGKFCIDGLLTKSKLDDSVEIGLIVLVCQKSIVNNTNASNQTSNNNLFDEIFRKMSVGGVVLSIPFLLCTFLVYALVGKLQNLHGKSLMCHVATLAMAYLGLLINSFKTDLHDSRCKTVAYGTQFSFLACFYWLNVMCFDLWWTFSGHRPVDFDPKRDGLKKFKIYSVYTWGSSLLITTITYCIQTFSLSTVLKVPNPNFGNGSCLYRKEETMTAYLYFYGPIGTLILCNLVMFVHTSVIIVRQMRSIDDAMSKSDSRRNIKKDTRKFVLYMKLFIIMGINWLMELLSYGFKDIVENMILTQVFDILNSIQGVFIFIIFVCKKDVMRLLNHKLYPQKIFIQPPTSLSFSGYNSSNISKSTVNTRCSTISTSTSGTNQ